VSLVKSVHVWLHFTTTVKYCIQIHVCDVTIKSVTKSLGRMMESSGVG